MTPVFHTSLSTFADQFDAYIIDLWGVLHDGRAPYPGSLEALRSLRSQNKSVILLSNAPRRAQKAIDVLTGMGFTPDLYDHVLTSGEATWHFLTTTQHYGHAFYYIGPPKDQDLLDGSPYIRVNSSSEANFTVVTGFDDDDSTLEEKLPDIEACLARGLPMVCANPDRVVVRQDGTRPLCAGIIAEEYARRGGHVHSIGKPYSEVYHQVLQHFTNHKKSRIAAIGDSLHTDIAGAQNMGIHAVLVTGGIMASELGINPGETPSEQALQDACNKEGVTPDAILPALRW